MYKKANLAKGTLSAQLLVGGSSLVLQTDEGLKFPDTGSGNTFAGVIWGASYASPELDSTTEFVTAYRSSGDTFTIVRSQEGTSAKQWEVGDNFMLTASAAVFDEYENAILAIASQLNPVGTIREFNVATNPATLLGFGTWEEYGKGKVTVAINATDTEFDTAGETGGAKTHILTSAELASHSHKVNPPATNSGTESADHTHGQQLSTGSNDSSPYYGKVSARDSNPNLSPSGQTTGISATHYHTTDIPEFDSGNAGSDSAHNNLQPYIVVYRWVRTA